MLIICFENQKKEKTSFCEVKTILKLQSFNAAFETV